MSDTPRTDKASFSADSGTADDYSPECVTADFARELERENAKLLTALRNLMPFVLEDYYPNCATPSYKAAVEAAKAITGTNEEAFR